MSMIAVRARIHLHARDCTAEGFAAIAERQHRRTARGYLSHSPESLMFCFLFGLPFLPFIFLYLVWGCTFNDPYRPKQPCKEACRFTIRFCSTRPNGELCREPMALLASQEC